MQMTKDKHPIVQGIVISRKNLIELVVIAILLACGVDLIAGHILALTILSPLVSVSVGAVLCVGSVLYLTTRLFARRIESRTYKAFLIYNKERNEIMSVPRYEFSEAIHRYMQAAFAENPALKTLWEKEPLKDLYSVDLDEATSTYKPQKAAQLLSEVIEYFVLKRLCTHLTDYFNDENFKKQNLEEYLRQDIPEVLLRNRFLELLSRPMEDRQAFVEDTLGGRARRKAVAVYLPGKAIYEKFNLILPKGSSVRRTEDNKIEIETKKLKMSITVRFEGVLTVLPQGFEEYYLRITDPVYSTSDYQVNVDIEMLMKLGALFSRTGWEYYHWVDSFLDKIEDHVSKDAFFDRLGWEAVFTLLQCFNQKQAKS